MVVFLANRKTVRVRQLHGRFENRFQSDVRFDTVRFGPATQREPGPYRVTAETDPRVFLDDDSYPATTARIEVGFELPGEVSHEFYWFNWIEPERDFLLGWHRDGDHPGLGRTHVQVNQDGSPVEHRAAGFVDAHPMAVLAARLDRLPDALASVQWTDGTVTGIDW